MSRTHAPLDTLVIAQLTALKQYEETIQQEFQSGQTEPAMAHLVLLQQRAERLNRMLDAMGAAPLSTWSLVPSGGAVA